MKQVLQLEKEDDLASLRTRFETSDFSHVVLVVARDYPHLENDPSLQLLRRAAQDTGVEVALVTRDDDLVERARDFGIPTFSAVGQARRENWRMSPTPGAMFAPLLTREVGDDARAATLSREMARTTLNNLREWRLPLAMIAIVLALFTIASFLLVPAANVRLVPASIPLSLSADIILDPTIPNVNSATRAIPARRITHELNGSASLRTTTTRNMPDARSAGTVVFQNRREEETVLPPNIVVKTSAGVPIRFTTVTTTTLPPGASSRVEAAILAVEPGPGSNVKELAINVIEGSYALEATVINLKPTQSGTVRPVRIVTALDKTRLETQLTQQLKSQALEALKPELKNKEFIPADSVVIDIGDKSFDRTVDEPADVLNMKINGDAYGLAIDPDDLELLIRALLQRQLQAGYQLLPSGIKVDSLTNGKYDAPALKISLKATGYATPQIDTTRVARAIQGKSADEAATYLSSQVQLAQPPQFNITPPLWNRMPWFSFRIAVFVEQGK